jgi:hypothetical protein
MYSIAPVSYSKGVLAMMRFVIVIITVLALPALAFSTTIHVPKDYSTIQAAIDAAANGDTVMVAPGIYKENLFYKGMGITVTSSAGPYTTIIDGMQAGRVVTFNQNEGPSAVLEGFSITNGKVTDGGGIRCMGSASPIIRKNAIYKNEATYMGGGIHCQDSAAPQILDNAIYLNISVAGGGISCMNAASPLIKGNGIYRNFPEHQGGAINLGGTASPVITENEMFDNIAGWGGGAINCGDAVVVEITHNSIHGNNGADGGGISFGVDSIVTISNNLICNNASNWHGGGIFCSSTGTITHNTIYDNTTYNQGKGGAIYVTVDGTVTVTDCICWHNTTGSGTDLEISGTPVVTYCDVEGGFAGTGNIDSDPLFFDADDGDFHLKQHPVQPGITNPCVDTGSDLASNLGMDALWTRTDEVPDSGTVDMGFHYGPYSPPWWKALQASAFEISEATGGQVVFTLSADDGNAFRQYLILGSISGTSPGTPLPGGMVVLPLNWDLFSNLVMNLLNTGIFFNFMGSLNGNGDAFAIFNMGPVPGAAGLKITYAYALASPWDFASNAVEITIVP